MMQPSVHRRMSRRAVLRLAGAAATLPAFRRRGAAAAGYPGRPVHVILGLPAGTGPDIASRLMAQWLSERLGQQFFVDNRPGAGTNIAADAVVRAAPDGYTLLFVTSSNAFNATLYKNLTFDFIRDIAPVASVGAVPFCMLVNPAVPAETAGEFIAYAKAHPGKINMASAGNGSANHVFGELFTMMAGIELTHVPYRDSYWPDLLAGQTQVLFAPMLSAMGYIKAGRLRALGVTVAKRLEALPDVPSLGEFVPNYEASGWLGLGAPKATAAEIVDALNRETNVGLADAKVRARFADVGAIVTPMTPSGFGDFIAAETQKWARVIDFAHISAD